MLTGHECATFRIIRFYKNGQRRTLRRDQTLATAQAHCSRNNTRGDWFDSYTHECEETGVTHQWPAITGANTSS